MPNCLAVANKFYKILRTAQPALLPEGSGQLEDMFESESTEAGDSDMHVSLNGPAIGAVDLGLQKSPDGKYQLSRDEQVINEFDSLSDGTAGLMKEVESYVQGMSATARVANRFMAKLARTKQSETSRVAARFASQLKSR